MKCTVSLWAVLGLVLLHFATEAQQAQGSADLIFLIDGSNNVRQAEFQFIQSFIENFIKDFNIGPNDIQIAVVQYSNTPRTEFYLNTYNTKTEVLKAVNNLQLKGGGEANIGVALQFLIDYHFTPPSGSRAAQEVPQVMILLTSRPSSDDVRGGVFSVKKQGTFTFVIGVKSADAAEANKIATDPSFTVLIPDYRRLDSTRQQLMPLFSLVAKKQLVIEVQESKVEAQVSKRDIIFLIDGSSTVGNANFLEISKFISNIVNKFVIGPDSVQVGLVQYSGDAWTEFYLNTHSRQSDLQTAIKKLRLKGGWEVNTGKALDYVFRNHFTRATGSRKEDGVPQLLVIIAGEKSLDDVKLPAETLKRAAVMTLAIGVNNADPAEISEIAIDPSLVFNVEQFRSLPKIKEQVLTPLSTLAGVTIVYEQPTEPPKKVVDKKDIVFLIDGSFSSGRRILPAVQNFIIKTVDAFDIGSDAVQVGLVLYSDLSDSEFFLNTYSTKDEIISHVRRLRPRGGTVLKTGEALKYVLKYLFTKYSGSRHEEGVPQFLVLITGGRSRDDVKEASETLSRAGIKTLAIGFEDSIKRQLREVSLDPSLALDMKDLRSLQEIEWDALFPSSTLNSVTQTSVLPISPTAKVVTKAAKKDIVFLIDGSFHVGNRNLPAIRSFITSIIESLDIGSDKVQVGLVQYSDAVTPEFYLNTYSSKDELIAKVKKLTLRGGNEVKTGAALDYVHKYIFTKYAGSRKEEGVPQFLVIITGGRSRDNIKGPSDALLRAGVMTLAIGAKNATRQQLQEAALEPSLVFNVKEFKSLPEIKQDVLLPLSTLSGVKIISETPTVKSINVENLRPVGGRGLNTGAAIEHVIRNVFSAAAGGRQVANIPQILVLLISGKSKDNVREAAGALKRAAIVTFVVGAADADGQELQEIAYSPNLLFVVQDFKSLHEIQDQLLQPLKTLIIEVIKMPTGVKEGHKRDIVFLIDGSSDVGTFFYLIRDLAINLIRNFNIAKDKDQVSVVQYSDNVRVEFPLNAYSTKEDLLAAVKRLQLKGGSKLKTGAALDFVRRNVFSKSGGGRKHLGISQILLLITSGKSQDDVKRPSEELKRAGVVPFTIGVGAVEASELRQIAYSPKLSFQVDDHWGLSEIDLHLLSISQNTENVPIPLTISTGVDRRDIVFLIDGSSKIGKGFQAVRKFMVKTVDSFDVGEAKVQFGVVQFSENPRTEFLLNTHSTKKNVSVAIKRLKLKRGQKINIGQALDHVMKNVFISSAGSRINSAIPQILVLITSGKSNDDISQQADKLRELGIVLFGIGLKKADQTVLEPLVYSPTLAFPVKTFQGLLNIQNQLQQIIKTVAVEVVETLVEDK
ncbi:collagen alpha-3(VI) chain isoform X3 [Mobula hypostoma]|uniref:collagen alpha-3(VI) chain isoform X3 n=1 Tax=Mobula hypostoma TaxID=723540 RepID=UPI002FC2E4B0